MSISIIVPQLGKGTVEATIVKWLKQKGEMVLTGEPLLELETDKINLEINAIRPGLLVHIECPDGKTVRPGEVVGILEYESQVDSKFTPVARRIAEEKGLDLSSLSGTGIGGRIRKEDVQKAILLTSHNAEPRTSDNISEITPLGSKSKIKLENSEPVVAEDKTTSQGILAKLITEIHQTGTVSTTFNEIDMSTAMMLRRKNRKLENFNNDKLLDLISFFVKAVVGALEEFPNLNSEIRDGNILKKKDYDIGISIGGKNKDIRLVLQNAAQMSFAKIDRKLRDYSMPETKSFSPTEIDKGSFGITDMREYGSILSTPLLSPSHVGILGLNQVDERPVVINGEVVIKPMMYTALSYDSRVIEVREAVQFLKRVKSMVEIPTGLLLEV